MGKPAATLGCTHTCPLSDGPKAHVGGNSIQGSPNVIIEKKPVVRQGDKLQCVSPSINMVQQGSTSVFINGRPAARMGDTTAHGGSITQGATSVFIG